MYGKKNHIKTKFKLARGCQGRVAVIGVMVVAELGGWVIEREKERGIVAEVVLR